MAESAAAAAAAGVGTGAALVAAVSGGGDGVSSSSRSRVPDTIKRYFSPKEGVKDGFRYAGHGFQLGGKAVAWYAGRVGDVNRSAYRAVRDEGSKTAKVAYWIAAVILNVTLVPVTAIVGGAVVASALILITAIKIVLRNLVGIALAAALGALIAVVAASAAGFIAPTAGIAVGVGVASILGAVVLAAIIAGSVYGLKRLDPIIREKLAEAKADRIERAMEKAEEKIEKEEKRLERFNRIFAKPDADRTPNEQFLFNHYKTKYPNEYGKMVAKAAGTGAADSADLDAFGGSDGDGDGDGTL